MDAKLTGLELVGEKEIYNIYIILRQLLQITFSYRLTSYKDDTTWAKR